MNDMELVEEIERLHLAFEEAKKGSIEDRALPVAKLQATLMVNRDQIITALRQAALAQTEIKGHMRVVDELREEIARLHQNWHDGMEDGIHRRQRKSGNNPGYAPAYNYGLDYAIHQENTARYKWWHERWTGTDSQLDELNKLDWSFDRPESWTEAIDAALKPRA